MSGLTRWLSVAFFTLFLTACTTRHAQFAVPERIAFQGNTYEKASQSQIEEMQQLLYLPSGSVQNPENWQQGLLLFLDANSQGKTLQSRARLREQTFARQGALAKVEIAGGELRSEVIYPPTSRFQNVQLEVSRGRELACGFAQMQLADKRSVSAKNLPKLATFQASLAELARSFWQLAWQIECK